MYYMKGIGRRIDICLTPHSILMKDDVVLFIDTNCSQLDRLFQSELRAIPCIRYLWRLLS